MPDPRYWYVCPNCGHFEEAPEDAFKVSLHYCPHCNDDKMERVTSAEDQR